MTSLMEIIKGRDVERLQVCGNSINERGDVWN